MGENVGLNLVQQCSYCGNCFLWFSAGTPTPSAHLIKSLKRALQEQSSH